MQRFLVSLSQSPHTKHNTSAKAQKGIPPVVESPTRRDQRPLRSAMGIGQDADLYNDYLKL
jgi:hypothetical protein